MLWTKAHLSAAKKILRRFPKSRYQEALNEIASATGRTLTGGSLRAVFLREGLGSPTSMMRAEPEETCEPDAPSESILHPSGSMKALIQLTKKGPIDFPTLCDKLDMSPSKTRILIESAQAQGAQVHVEHGHVGIKSDEPVDRIRSVGVAPVVGQRQKIAVISDTHLGSKYCLRDQLKDFIHHAYKEGVREILHPGDVLDGMYRHGLWEVSHSGLDAQTQDLFETLPHLPGLNYRCITGNHDQTFTDASGVDVGNFIANYFKERGRNDIHFYGNRGAFLKVGGVVVHLWHPRSGVPYARSYGVQKQIEKYTVIKPQLLLTGHWHIFTLVTERGIQGIACPTFQGGGSAFGKSIGGAPAIGGLILSWDLTEHGTMRSFILEKRAYFEVEKPVELENPVDGIKVRTL